MSIPFIRHWPNRFLALVVMLLSQACLDQSSTEPLENPDPREAASAREDLGEDPYMVALARQIPGFAGFFAEPGSGRIVIAMAKSNAGGFPAARRAVLAQFAQGNALPVEFVERVVEFSFLELARHRARLRPGLFRTRGVGTLSVNERSNRIDVGLLEQSARAAVLDLAAELSVPVEMISFSKASPARFLDLADEEPHPSIPTSPTLQDAVSVPDARIRGGYQIQSKRVLGECTLGFNAWLKGTSIPEVPADGPGTPLDDSVFGFVTASHCSQFPGLNASSWGQPTRDDYVGTSSSESRDYDVAFVRYDSLIQPERMGLIGQIGRPMRGNNSITVDTVSPTIEISGKALNVGGLTVQKIGRTSGWTSGSVSDTCQDVIELGYTCVGEIWFMDARDGDSGGPVFVYDEDEETAEIAGIILGGSPDGSRVFFGTIKGIEKALGATLQVVRHPGDWCGTEW